MDGSFSVFSTFIVRIHTIRVILLLEYSFNFKGVLAVAILALPVDQRVIDIDSRRFASIEKALVELITNSDDSYSRLEKQNIPTNRKRIGNNLLKFITFTFIKKLTKFNIKNHSFLI